MDQPRFQIGQSARYRGTRGTIHSVINRNNPSDVACQGYRYEILIKGALWSAPEAALQPFPSVDPIQGGGK
jgi:hypothetical protein